MSEQWLCTACGIGWDTRKAILTHLKLNRSYCLAGQAQKVSFGAPQVGAEMGRPTGQGARAQPAQQPAPQPVLDQVPVDEIPILEAIAEEDHHSPDATEILELWADLTSYGGPEGISAAILERTRHLSVPEECQDASTRRAPGDNSTIFIVVNISLTQKPFCDPRFRRRRSFWGC